MQPVLHSVSVSPPGRFDAWHHDASTPEGGKLCCQPVIALQLLLSYSQDICWLPGVHSGNTGVSEAAEHAAYCHGLRMLHVQLLLSECTPSPLRQ